MCPVGMSSGPAPDPLEILSDIRAIERRHPKLYRVVTGHFGERGHAFFRALPETVSRLTARWELRLGEPFGDLSLNYVCRVTRAAQSGSARARGAE